MTTLDSILAGILGPARLLFPELTGGERRGRLFYHQIKAERGIEPDRRTKGRRGAAKRVADRAAWNAGRR